jgi:pyruvate,water dikinase
MLATTKKLISNTNSQLSAALTWEQAVAAGPEVCGGKGYNLGRLHRYGFRIPRGGVIPAAWYNVASAFGLCHGVIERVSAENVVDPPVTAALEGIRQTIEAAELPAALVEGLAEFLDDQGLMNASVSVRSSATTEDSARASFAGIHRSSLNVRGIDEIARAILGCYASLWTPQAVAYRRKMNFADDEVQCAVVICEMVEAKCAGVAFSFDPVSGRRDLVVIDAAPGLGEAVVSGAVDPQRIVYRETKGKLLYDSCSGGAALLPPDREHELAHQVHRMQWAFGDGQDAQDIEWAYDGEQLWFLQVRPATNVRPYLPAAISHLPRHWSTANIKDAIPGVICTLSWSLLKKSVSTLAYAGPTVGGYQVDTGAEVVRRFKGRAYFELTLMQWVMYDALGAMPRQLVQSIGGHQPEIPVPGDPTKGAAGRRRLMASLRLLRRIWTIERDLARMLSDLKVRLREMAAVDLTAVSERGLRAFYNKLRFDHDSMGITIGVANCAESPWELALETILKRWFGSEARAVMGKLLAGTGALTSAEHGYAIFELAAEARKDLTAREWLDGQRPATDWVNLPYHSGFRAALARFLEQFGHRAVYEADYLNPRWAEDPTYILDQVRFFLANPQTAASREGAQSVREETEAKVRRAAGWRARIVFWLAGRLRRAMAARERAKSSIAELSIPSKRLAVEIGRRLVKAGHLNRPEQAYFLSITDIQCWLEGWWSGEGARELTADRARQREAWLAEEAPPDVISEAPDGRVTTPPVASGRRGETWIGIGAAPGRARGRVRVIRHPAEGNALQAGEILVAPSTDPGWTPLFLRASAIVMATGGYLSHGAIVAREYGIPAVVNLPGILEDLKTGDMLVVDGDGGRVTRESERAITEPSPFAHRAITT